MTCLLGRSGLQEFRVILLLRGLERECAEAGGRCGRHWEVVGDREGVRKGAGGLGEVQKAKGKCGRDGKVTLCYSTFLLRPSPQG